jgi:TonB family protein
MTKTMPFRLALLAVLSGVAVAQPRNLGLVSYRAPAVPKLEMDGSAIVVLTIRANGRVDDAVTLAASDRVLGQSARDAVLEWRFGRDPTLGQGRDAMPSLVLRREVVEFVFKRDGVVTSMSHFESAKSWFPPEQTSPIRLLRSEQIDMGLVRVASPTSEDTTKLVARLSVAGTVVVSFVVDETGKVRVPIAERTEEPALIEAALAVVGGWRYAPPTHGGEPVLVEERNTLTFRPHAH